MRYPAVAGRFYPDDKDELTAMIKSCFTGDMGPGMPSREGSKRSIVGAIAPHAGYVASGTNAAHVYKQILEDGLPEAYILVGPDHNGVPYDFVMCNEDHVTPLGTCQVHEGIAKKLKELIPNDCSAHRLEHSIEVQIPFIQFIDPDPRIVPIIMRDQSITAARELSEHIQEACKGMDVIVIASSDMSHYIPKPDAEILNRLVLDRIEEKDIEGMYSVIKDKKISICGYGPMAAAMISTEPSSIEILEYSDSWDSLKQDINSVVGYGSALMYR